MIENAEKERVISALKNCLDRPRCRNCPWHECEEVFGDDCAIPRSLAEKALALVEELMTVEPPEDYLQMIIDKEDDIMHKKFFDKDNDPSALLEFGMARSMKAFLLMSKAEITHHPVVGKWIKLPDGTEGCSICMAQRKSCDLNGTCVMCGAKMEGGETDGT